MARRIDWESQIGRRLKLRDLHVFFTVAQHGSMPKRLSTLAFPSRPFRRSLAISSTLSAFGCSTGTRRASN
jgi:hypothetical protein